MQLGFVLDQSRCIGCHACTVACKAENDVPVGNFRTWVKYTETGSFPTVKRHFTVLRCNQCTDAPCVTICPVTALQKRPDGIVDVDPSVCIGCKGCMQACPYDALYINEDEGTAQKCHFCAHRTEQGLAPACAVVCPTEAIIAGDFHDPESRVSKMRRDEGLAARKTEAGTGPNVFYKEAHASGLDPSLSNIADGFMWSDQQAGIQLDAQRFEAQEQKPQARTVYDVGHAQPWGDKVTAYLLTKSVAAGLALAGLFVMPVFHPEAGLAGAALPWIPGLALFFLLVTTGLLIADLKRPERFLLILRRPNWDSWLTRGSWILLAYAMLLGIWFWFALWAPDRGPRGLVQGFLLLTAILAALTSSYTGWLFGQSKGRVLWMKRGLAFHLLVQAFVAGSAVLLLVAPFVGFGLAAVDTLHRVLLVTLLLHQVLTMLEGRFAPRRREAEYKRTVRLMTHGPFARRRWVQGVGLGMILPILLLAVSVPFPFWSIAAALALFGLYVEEDLLVRAGQALPIS